MALLEDSVENATINAEETPRALIDDVVSASDGVAALMVLLYDVGSCKVMKRSQDPIRL